MTEPKPCPFCGSTKVEIVDGSSFRWVAAECSECGARSGEVRIPSYANGTPDERIAKATQAAIEEWNTRTV
jgi:Lar family restriction alleviation protein